MKRLFAFYIASWFLLLISFSGVNAQSGTWVWMNGDSIRYNPGTFGPPSHFGTYGTQGIASVNNSPPGLAFAAQWIDKQGNFWIFGGEGIDTLNYVPTCSNLWKYDPTANTWTWVMGPGYRIYGQLGIYGTLGVPSIFNTPGARLECSSWTDSHGDLWLFGGTNWNNPQVGGNLNDLWKYHIATNEWTWMGGSATPNQPGVYGILFQSSTSSVPPSRTQATGSWTDANDNLWLFGGRASSPSYSDLWRYNIASGQWTWMGGSQQLNAPSIYGTLGIEDPSNFPGGRNSYAQWKDSNYLYLSGGWHTYTKYNYNDVWRFNLNTNYWTWIGGDSGASVPGTYSSLCSTGHGDEPRGRWMNSSCQSNACSPVLFMWGGGMDLLGDSLLNDLWSFELGSLRWRWISGYDSISPHGNYGAKGSYSPTNMPSCAWGACFWSDRTGNLWIWGGYSSIAHPGYYNNEVVSNAMWKYTPDPACFAGALGNPNLSYQLTPNALCSGDSALISFSGDSALSISPNNFVTWLDSVHAILKPDTSTTFTINGYSPCGTHDVQIFTLPVVISPVTISSSKIIICPGDTAQICAFTGFTNYIWNTGDTTACINATSAGNYYVTVSENGTCSATSSHLNLSIYTSPPITISVNDDTLTGYNAVTYQWLLNGVPISNATASVYIAKAFGSYTLQVTDTNGCTTTSNPVRITGIANELMESSITIYPNPTSTGWQLSVNAELLGSTAEVFDATGRLVFQSAIRNPLPMAIGTEILIPGLAKGIYELRITGQGYSVVRKLVKM